MNGRCPPEGPGGGGAGEASRPIALASQGDKASAGGVRNPPEPVVLSGCPSATSPRDGGSDGHRRDWRLPTTERSVTVLRRRLAEFLDQADLSIDERYDLLLAVCEAASNAIEHARDPTEPFFDVLTEIVDSRVTVVVRDHGQWSDGSPGIHRGRGLAMMWTLADSTVVPGPHGTTVTIRSSPRHGRQAVASNGDAGTAGRTSPASSAEGTA